MSKVHKTISIKEEERKQFKEVIVESIKTISESSEGTEQNNYPTITTLCDLFQKLNN